MGLVMHPPMIVFVMLFGLALTSSLLAGYGMAHAVFLSDPKVKLAEVDGVDEVELV